MAELSTLARPYAKAAFDYANEQSVISEWEDFLFIASTVVSDKSFADILDNPAVSAQQKAEVIIDIYDNQIAVDGDTPFKTLVLTQSYHQQSVGSDLKVAKLSMPIKNFVHQLAEQDRLVLIPQIYDQYQSQRAKALKQVDAYITSAYALNETQRLLLKNRLEQTLNASVILHESIDSSLIGGATIKIGDKVVDDSISGKLKQLKTQLIA